MILNESGERSSPNRDRGVTDFQKIEDLPSKNTTSEGLGGGGDTKLITSELKHFGKVRMRIKI